jgi:hypothetical protein
LVKAAEVKKVIFPELHTRTESSCSDLRISGPLHKIQDISKLLEHEVGVLTTSLQGDEHVKQRSGVSTSNKGRHTQVLSCTVELSVLEAERREIRGGWNHEPAHVWVDYVFTAIYTSDLTLYLHCVVVLTLRIM